MPDDKEPAKKLYPDADEDTIREISMLPDKIRRLEVLKLQQGVEYCGDAEDYLAALEIYRKSIDSKAVAIEKQLSNEDYEAYTITVHSLKSTSIAIGAQQVFELALMLEQAGKNRDVDTMVKYTPELLRVYRGIKSGLDDYFEG